MFKPTHFRFDHSVQWPGAGPTSEIHADTVRNVEDQGDQYMFVHASGYAFKIDKAQVTAYGVWEDEDVPNMPNPDVYPDGNTSDKEADNATDTDDISYDTDTTPTDTDAQAGTETTSTDSNTDDMRKDTSSDNEYNLSGEDTNTDADTSDDIASDAAPSSATDGHDGLDNSGDEGTEELTSEILDLSPVSKRRRKKK